MPVDSVYRKGKKNFSIFCTVIKIVLSLHRIKGVLAHLARARHWQCRGERFESAILHPESELGAESEFAFLSCHFK